MTESGFVRTSSNRTAWPTSTTPAIAVELLTRLTELGAHEFWADDVRFVVGTDATPLRGLRGHRRVPDAHLVALAQGRQGRVATFDRGLGDLDGAAVVDLVPTSD